MLVRGFVSLPFVIRSLSDTIKLTMRGSGE
jgi:hypothetical protein